MDDLSKGFAIEHRCAYYADGRQAREEVVMLDEAAARAFDDYLAMGYRRAAGFLYRPVCEGCLNCVPIRLRPELFAPGRSQRRTMRKNRDLDVRAVSPLVTPEKAALYASYQKHKHPRDEAEPHDDPEAALLAIHYGYARTIEMDYRLDGRLVGVGVVDEGDASLSSVYFYYDPHLPGRRLGAASILREIALAFRLEKSYYYLGFCIEDNPKMAYKKDFGPCETLVGGAWRPFPGALGGGGA